MTCCSWLSTEPGVKHLLRYNLRSLHSDEPERERGGEREREREGEGEGEREGRERERSQLSKCQ